MDVSSMLHKDLKLLFQGFSRVVGSGYGSVHHNFMMELLRRGIDLVGTDSSVKPNIHIFLGQPNRTDQNAWKRKAEVCGIFTMFETEVLPPNWVEDINNSFDFVLVPSVWCKDIFEKGGIAKPVFVIPLGINPGMFPYLKRPARKMFTIIWQGFHDKDRKGYALLDKAFEELDLPNARLIKKVSPFSMQSPIQWEFKTSRWSICKNMNQVELLMLLREADLSVNPTSGEGFGLIPLEHMATGLPVIVSENSGCLDYCNSLYNIGIKCQDGLSWFGPEYGSMKVPIYGDLKAKILYAYECRQEMKLLGNWASAWVHDKWTYRRATDKLLEVINGFVS